MPPADTTSFQPIRVLIVDDSAVMRSLLKLVLSSEPAIALAGCSGDGHSALESIERLNPDLVLLDIEMPGLNGLEVLHRLRSSGRRLPIIMCSTLTRRGAAITLEALAAGAADYVTKPAAQNGITEAVASLKQVLIPKILALCPPAERDSRTPAVHTDKPPAAIIAAPAPSIVVIGISTGGPAALEQMLPAFPADFSVPLLIVQHMPALFTSLLAERLDRRCALAVREATQGAAIAPGTAWIAKGDWHLELVSRPLQGAAGVQNRTGHLRLTQSAAENNCRPSVDVLFRSVAAIYGPGTLAVVMTGMGSDGLDGCRAVHAAGGTVLVQDRSSSAVWGMPGAVAEAGLAHRIVPLAAMANEILRRTAAAHPVPVSVFTAEV